MNMKIKSIEPFLLYAQDTEIDVGRKNIGGYTGHQVLVKIDTDEGISGWGESCINSENGEGSLALYSLIKNGLTPKLIGEDPLQVRRIWEKMYTYMEWWGRRGIGMFALSAIDTALMDISGKYFGVPCATLMGGIFRNEVDVYASLLFDMENPEMTGKKALPYLNKGYFGVKYGWGLYREKPFGADMKKDEEIISTIRNIIGKEANLMVDVGRYVDWNYEYALKMARMLKGYNIYWLEEPLPQEDLYGFKNLTRESGVTIAAGEGYQTSYDFHMLLRNEALGLYQPDPSKLGGLSEAKKVVDLVESYNRSWVPHNWSTIVNTAASLQLVASSKSGFLVEHKQEKNPFLDELAHEKLEVSNGKLRIPLGPGLGIRMNEDAVRKYQVETRDLA